MSAPDRRVTAEIASFDPKEKQSLVNTLGTPTTPSMMMASTMTYSHGFAELALLSPGDSFGEMALIEHVPRSARAVAHTEVGLLVLESRDLDGWLASDPRAAMGFFACYRAVRGWW